MCHHSSAIYGVTLAVEVVDDALLDDLVLFEEIVLPLVPDSIGLRSSF